MLSHFWDHCSAFVDLRHSSLQGPGIRDQATAICWKDRLSPLNGSELRKQGIASICNFVICTFLALFWWTLSRQPLFQAIVCLQCNDLWSVDKLLFTFLWSWPLSRPDPFSWLFCLLTVECWGRAPSPLRLNWTPKAVKQDSESADGDSDTIYSLSTPTPP